MDEGNAGERVVIDGALALIGGFTGADIRQEIRAAFAHKAGTRNCTRDLIWPRDEGGVVVVSEGQHEQAATDLYSARKTHLVSGAASSGGLFWWGELLLEHLCNR
ncbi:MAG: hypothetical protein CL447_06525 [Acidimicrobiaceae bacterium]|nr:hypothetical protein [Acidimicrobiaceae bacterium]